MQRPRETGRPGVFLLHIPREPTQMTSSDAFAAAALEKEHWTWLEINYTVYSRKLNNTPVCVPQIDHQNRCPVRGD